MSNLSPFSLRVTCLWISVSSSPSLFDVPITVRRSGRVIPSAIPAHPRRKLMRKDKASTPPPTLSMIMTGRGREGFLSWSWDMMGCARVYGVVRGDGKKIEDRVDVRRLYTSPLTQESLYDRNP
jgi:hypothetical protein